MKILGVFAHPADMVTEAGGTFALHADQGDHVKVVVLTHGGRIHPNIYVEESRIDESVRKAEIAKATREKVIAIKHAEMNSAAEILGIQEVSCLDFEDNMIAVSEKIVERVAAEIEDFQPHILVAHHPGFGPGIGSPHSLAGQTAVAAASRAFSNLSNLDEKSSHFIRQMFFVSAGVSSRNMFDPGGGHATDTFIDITSVVERKVRALDQFVSQGYEGDYARKCVLGHNGHWGSLAMVGFAEPYMMAYPTTHRLLPLTSFALETDVLTMHRKYSQHRDLWTIPVEPSPTTIELSSNQDLQEAILSTNYN